jgi:NADP-dependent 3-hydroxy acid dehydrogenase YdfG
MLTITLAYSTDNQTTAHRIASDLASHVEFQHIGVGRANEGPVLADLIKNNDDRLIVLISNDFLTNPNCMLRGHEVFGSKREVLPVMIRSHVYDELQDEVVSTQTALTNQTEVMQYVNHWQDRYINLRQTDDFQEEGGEAFHHYRRKIRETSVQVEEVLHLIKDSWSLTETQFSASHYQQLFIFAERPRLWDEFKAYEETPVDLAGIPGLEMLGKATNTEEEARPPVQEKLEEQSVAPPDPEPDASNITTTPSQDMTETTVANANTEEILLPSTALSTEMSPEEQVNVWIDRAWSMHDDGDPASALELLNAGRDALPDHHKLHYHYALLLATSTEDALAAQQEVEALLDHHPEHADGLYLSGELALAAGHFTKARESWEQLSDSQPFYPELNYRLGTLVVDHFPADYLDAAAYLRRATRNAEPTADAFYRYGLLLAGPVGRQKKAIKVLRKAVAADPRHAYAHYELAVLLHQRGNYDAARNAFQLAKHINPAFDTAANRKAFATVPLVTATTPAEEDALAALKQNIASLEAMMHERDLAESTSPAVPMSGAEIPAAPPQKGAGKTVLISGATSGIGRATARRLAEDGFRLILLGRRIDRLKDLAAELFDKHETETFLLQLDVTDREAVVNAPNLLPEDWQRIDVLLNNAGKAKGTDPIHEGELDHWDEMIDVNLKGLLYLTRVFSPAMVARQSGMIVNVCSTAGKEVYPNGNVYCATKHAVDALTHAMRLDLVKYGIRVGQICPAMVEETEFSVVRYDGDTERAKIYEDFQPLRSPDVAEAIAFMITQPAHVNVLDMVIQGTQQASSTVVDRSGREKYATEEE